MNMQQFFDEFENRLATDKQVRFLPRWVSVLLFVIAGLVVIWRLLAGSGILNGWFFLAFFILAVAAICTDW